jgi:hypothetical protein
MAETLNEQEQLIADLLEEVHGLRMKYEEFSLYTEAKIAEFVIARKALNEERDRAVHHMGLAEMDLEVLRRRQEQLHEQLIKAVQQRDRARERVAALEASRAVRFAVRLRKLLRR